MELMSLQMVHKSAAQVDGTPGLNDMPTAFGIFNNRHGSASPTERMRIDSAGALTFGTLRARTLGSLAANTGGLIVEDAHLQQYWT